MFKEYIWLIDLLKTYGGITLEEINEKWVQTEMSGGVEMVRSTFISKKVDTINQHIDKVLENAPTKLKVSVKVNDADWQKIQELFAKEHQWIVSQMQMHIREVNSMFADERRKVRERYKEYDGCYLGHYAQWFFWLFFTIGIFVVAGGIGMMIAQNYVK